MSNIQITGGEILQLVLWKDSSQLKGWISGRIESQYIFNLNLSDSFSHTEQFTPIHNRGWFDLQMSAVTAVRQYFSVNDIKPPTQRRSIFVFSFCTACRAMWFHGWFKVGRDGNILHELMGRRWWSPVGSESLTNNRALYFLSTTAALHHRKEWVKPPIKPRNIFLAKQVGRMVLALEGR
jgi:hypothetical protein